MPTQLDSRQVVLRAAQSMLGSAANDALNTIFPKIDAEMAKLFEDRNVLLTDGGIITFTGTQIQFTEDLRISINQNVAGAAPYVATLGQATITLANNEMVWAIVNRVAATATLAQGLTMPAVNSTNQEVFLIAKRVDAGDGTQRVYWRTGMAQNAGQSNRLGASGSGSGGSGIGDDLGVLLFQASFRDPFEEGPTDTKSAVNTTAGFTDPTAYNAAKALYQLNYDASKTIAAGTTTTNINLSAVADFTVKIGDVVIANNQARRITAVASQQSFTTEAFSIAPTLASQVTVSQAVHTKDIYNFAVDGNALSAEFGATQFQEVMFDYEDTTTVGDAIFDVNVAPVIGLSASQNGTDFTDVKIRPTLGTSQIQSFALPAAGTGLTVRFFAYKQSGSGSVNILGYRAFMQKQESQGLGGGITNSAYAFTNSVGTPINCSVGVAGGKTTITLNWQYAVGVYAGTTASSIEVWLNGQKLPRFVNATLTPDGSFLETSSSIITLDKDYSSQNLSVEVFQRTQIVDNSTINTTNISSLQQMMAQSPFQGFVAQNTLMVPTTVAGTPAAGQFYSAIQNRAPIPDLSQDLKVRMGIDRIMFEGLTSIQNEMGATGNRVYGVLNDMFDQIRIVGSADWVASSGGQYIRIGLASDVTAYMEITFFGTGINLLMPMPGAATSGVVSVDGGAESANVITQQNAFNSGRNYNANSVQVIASGLTLGVHTVRIRNTSATASLHISGIEIVNTVSTLSINPGSSYVNGQKLTIASVQAPAYNSGFESGTLGTRGGHAVVYQKGDGSIAKAVTPTGSQLNLTSADHTNEEIARIYHFREFGQGRSDDLSTAAAATTSRAFTLEDGTTSLNGIGWQANYVNGEDYVGIDSVLNNNFTFVFVGTGLDIFFLVNTHTTGYTVILDGVAIATNSTTVFRTTTNSWIKIASGLPYGTHTLRIQVASAAGGANFTRFAVYQPKKPAIPSNAVELADYNIMADYNGTTITGTAIADNIQMPVGALYKAPARENVYVGANWQFFPLVPDAFAGWSTTTLLNNNQTATLQFFGTGIVLHMGASVSGTYDFTVAIDGSLSAAGVARSNASNLGAGSYRSTASATAYQPCRIEFTGLTLGLHSITIQRTAGAGNFTYQGVHVITPIHSHKSNLQAVSQNALPSGSQSVSDNRKITPIKDNTANKYHGKAIGITLSPTTTSTVLLPVPDLYLAVKSNGGWFSLNAYIIGSINTAANWQHEFFVNGLQVSNLGVGGPNSLVTGQEVGATITDRIYLPAGIHYIAVYARVSGGTGTYTTIKRMLMVDEL